jgi:DNA polymerase elongation subunit (family B)
MIGMGIESGHPLTRMIDGRWISAYCSDWLGGFAAVFAYQQRAESNTVDATRLETLERNYLDAKIRELEAAKPDLMIVQKSDTFWVPHVMQRADFADFMNDYRLLAEAPTVRVYLRNGSGKIPSTH